MRPVVAVEHTDPPPEPDAEVTAELLIPLEATAEIPVAQRDTPARVDVIDASAMADPQAAHSPMSPEDRISDEHVGLPMEQHTTGGTTPQS